MEVQWTSLIQIWKHCRCLCNKYGSTVDVSVANMKVQWTHMYQIWSEIAVAGVQRFTPAEVVAGIRWGRETGAREEPSSPVLLTPRLPVLLTPGLPVIMIS